MGRENFKKKTRHLQEQEFAMILDSFVFRLDLGFKTLALGERFSLRESVVNIWDQLHFNLLFCSLF
jgi:hypothetical protein